MSTYTDSKCSLGETVVKYPKPGTCNDLKDGTGRGAKTYCSASSEFPLGGGYFVEEFYESPVTSTAVSTCSSANLASYSAYASNCISTLEGDSYRFKCDGGVPSLSQYADNNCVNLLTMSTAKTGCNTDVFGQFYSKGNVTVFCSSGSDDDNSGLSSASIAGIVVGTAAGSVLLLMAVAYIVNPSILGFSPPAANTPGSGGHISNPLIA